MDARLADLAVLLARSVRRRDAARMVSAARMFSASARVRFNAKEHQFPCVSCPVFGRWIPPFSVGGFSAIDGDTGAWLTSSAVSSYMEGPIPARFGSEFSNNPKLPPQPPRPIPPHSQPSTPYHSQTTPNFLTPSKPL